MQDNTVYADALEAHLFCLEAELDVRNEIAGGQATSLEARVLRATIERVAAELNQVKGGNQHG